MADKPSKRPASPAHTTRYMINGERTGARPEKAFGLLLCLDYDLMLKSWHGNQMLGNQMSWPRNRSRRGPGDSAAQLFRGQIRALHTLLVSASVAARITPEGSVINKVGRSAVSERQISPKDLKWTLAPHSGSVRSVHRLPRVARRRSCSTPGLATNCHCALSPCPPPPLSRSCSPR